MVAGCPSEGPLSAEDAADRMLAAHGKSFHWARRFLGPVAARRATLLYAFCRFLDDIADGDLPGGLPRLRAIDMALIDGTVGDLPPDMAEVATFLALSQEAAIPRAAARDLIAGLIFDQGTVALEDQAALIVYAYQVAGTVGLMMAPILGRRDRRADAFAVDLGIAMQLTNIARDVAEDAGLGRRYLPAIWCGALTPAEIAAGMRDPAALCRASVATAVGETLVWAETITPPAWRGSPICRGKTIWRWVSRPRSTAPSAAA